MNDLVAILLSVVIVSLIAFIGILFIGLKEKLFNRITVLLVGFASGTLLGGAFLHLLPEALSSGGDATSTFLYVISGIVVFFILEKFFYWRHCHEKNCPTHAFVYLNLFGDGIHNFIDGMVIAATFMTSIELGLVTTLAVVFHEIPQEIGDFGILVYGGLERRRAMLYNFISAITAILGALTTYFLAYLQSLGVILVPFAAGGFIYIAATDLIPELHKKAQTGESLIQLTLILLGIGLMAFLKYFFEV
ncbi:MAG: ZIP family metal transporter [Candidatus Bathyarchaeota archaeon]|nr:ZIP family metal transporter [Candidatus Bathyarchaeota archaeon]MCX8176930.1 ZIP family metal transporter [Candidatus Bathyarchaeota archaeon]MDW8193383.1 ZIP family metal transporter [Nitrososphaerota archaeon]